MFCLIVKLFIPKGNVYGFEQKRRNNSYEKEREGVCHDKRNKKNPYFHNKRLIFFKEIASSYYPENTILWLFFSF